MKNLFLLFIVLFMVSVLSSGCASVVTGSTQQIPVSSNPPGAKVTADNGTIIVTPASIILRRKEPHTLVAEFPGYEPQQQKLEKKLNNWIWGNILIGGGIGAIIDFISGSADELNPKEVHFNFKSPGQKEATEAVLKKEVPVNVTKDIKKQQTDNENVQSPKEQNSSTATSSSVSVIKCGNCGHEIGQNEGAFVHKGKIVCSECYAKLKNQP